MACKTVPGLFGSQSEVKHYKISQECLNCGYVFPVIERDEAAYKVVEVLKKMRCPVCLSKDYISAAIVVTPDRFTAWNSKIDYEVDDIKQVEDLAKAIRSCYGTA